MYTRTQEEAASSLLPQLDGPATGANITRLRKAAGLSVRDLQRLFNFSTPQAIYKWQNGEALPTLPHLAALAKLFGVSMDEIIVWKADAHMDNDHNLSEHQ